MITESLVHNFKLKLEKSLHYMLDGCHDSFLLVFRFSSYFLLLVLFLHNHEVSLNVGVLGCGTVCWGVVPCAEDEGLQPQQDHVDIPHMGCL